MPTTGKQSAPPYLLSKYKSRALKTFTGEMLRTATLPVFPKLMPWLRSGGESALFFATTGAGKSFLTLATALAIAGDGVLFNRGLDGKEQEVSPPWRPDPTEDGFRVHYLCGEMTLAAWKIRLSVLLPGLQLRHPERLASHFRVTGRRVEQVGPWFPELSSPSDMAWLLAQYKRSAWWPALLIFDNLSSLATLRSELDGAAYAGVLASLSLLANAKISVLVVHHGRVRDSSGQRGSPILLTPFDSVFHLVPISDHPEVLGRRPAALTIRQLKNRDLRIPEFSGVLHPTLAPEPAGSTSTWYVESGKPRPILGGRPGGITSDDLLALPPGLTVRDQAKALGVSERTVYRIRKSGRRSDF